MLSSVRLLVLPRGRRETGLRQGYDPEAGIRSAFLRVSGTSAPWLLNRTPWFGHFGCVVTAFSSPYARLILALLATRWAWAPLIDPSVSVSPIFDGPHHTVHPHVAVLAVDHRASVRVGADGVRIAGAVVSGGVVTPIEDTCVSTYRNQCKRTLSRLSRCDTARPEAWWDWGCAETAHGVIHDRECASRNRRGAVTDWRRSRVAAICGRAGIRGDRA